MGISVGKTALVIVSALRSKVAPARAEAGSSTLLSGPTKKRIKWGIIRPTKPMMPDTETHTPVIRDAVIRRVNLTLFVSTPKEAADRSPNDIIFRSRAKKRQIKKPMDTNTKVKSTSVHVLEPKLPINQNIIIETCSSAIYFIKLMPADNIAATIIPDNIRLWEDALPLKEDKNITANSVPDAPINANNGTE